MVGVRLFAVSTTAAEVLITFLSTLLAGTRIIVGTLDDETVFALPFVASLVAAGRI